MSEHNNIEVLVIDDEEIVRQAVMQTLELEGYKVAGFEDPNEAIKRCSDTWNGVIICDLRMDIMDGIEVLQRVLAIDADIPVIMFSAHADIATAIKAIRLGAYDFLEKTDDPEQQLNRVERAWKKRQLVLENRQLKQLIQGHHQINDRLVGHSAAIQQLRQDVLQLAQVDVDIIVMGDTGTGKEVVAKSLHDFSVRANKPFVALNCGALAESVMESELFGHEAGAFTGALKKRIGKIEYANGGTLFLDEIESMPASLQVRLLRVLQERCLQRVGGNNDINVDIRVVAASKVDLLDAAKNSEFREDLYYRLNVARVDIPRLSQRKQDIGVLFNHFVEQSAQQYEQEVREVPFALLQQLELQPWPGNVRELRNAAQRWAIGLALNIKGATFEQSQLPADDLETSLADYERGLISKALNEHNGQIELTASALGIPRKKLYLRMKKYQLERKSFNRDELGGA